MNENSSISIEIWLKFVKKNKSLINNILALA